VTRESATRPIGTMQVLKVKRFNGSDPAAVEREIRACWRRSLREAFISAGT
jgi:hypothetical protein